MFKKPYNFEELPILIIGSSTDSNAFRSLLVNSGMSRFKTYHSLNLDQNYISETKFRNIKEIEEFLMRSSMHIRIK